VRGYAERQWAAAMTNQLAGAEIFCLPMVCGRDRHGPTELLVLSSASSTGAK